MSCLHQLIKEVFLFEQKYFFFVLSCVFLLFDVSIIIINQPVSQRRRNTLRQNIGFPFHLFFIFKKFHFHEAFSMSKQIFK